MLKLLYFTDPHVRISSPRSRKDNYVETVMKKLQCVAQIGKEAGVDAYICGGDWLDRPDIPYSMLGTLMGTLSNHFDKPIFTVLGNHEEYGYNPDTHRRTALYVLTAAGVVTRLGNEPIVVEGIGDKAALTGVDAHSKLDKGERIDDYVACQRVEGVTNIRVVHGYLKDGPEFPKIPSTDIKDIEHTEADMILTGHEHCGYGVIKRNEKFFCNPGALSRVSASVGDVNLDVKVALITIDKAKASIELIPLPKDVARPASEVLDRIALEEEKQHKQAMTEFANSAKNAVERFQFQEGLDLTQALERFIEDNNVPEDIALIIRKEMERAEMEVHKKEGA